MGRVHLVGVEWRHGVEFLGEKSLVGNAGMIDIISVLLGQERCGDGNVKLDRFFGRQGDILKVDPVSVPRIVL